jgi:hypothetical protein
VIGALAGPQHVADVAVDLVRPALVLREHAARDDVVADDRRRRHVPEDRARISHAVIHQGSDRVHVEALDEVGAHLVDDDDQHTTRRVIGRTRDRRWRGGDGRRRDQRGREDRGGQVPTNAHTRSPSTPGRR